MAEARAILIRCFHGDIELPPQGAIPTAGRTLSCVQRQAALNCNRRKRRRGNLSFARTPSPEFHLTKHIKDKASPEKTSLLKALIRIFSVPAGGSKRHLYLAIRTTPNTLREINILEARFSTALPVYIYSETGLEQTN